MSAARRIDIPKSLKDFAQVFTNAGYSCYFVGGAVRDSLLGLPVNDWDAATNARPEEVQKLFKAVIPTGIQHGTVTVRWRDSFIETTTFRLDGKYEDGRHPETVEYSDKLAEDLSRRDFTINGMAADPETGRIIDPHGGLNDLSARLVNAIGDPLERFNEDGLRPLRAIRFASRLGFSISRSTLAAIPLSIPRFRLVSKERIRDEFSKILLSDSAGDGIRRLEDSGLLREFIPELSACKGVLQGEAHHHDVLEHLIQACDMAPKELELRLAALFHDLGKPSRRQEQSDGSLAFYGHDTESARLSEEVLKRLKYPNAVIDKVAVLVKYHMFDYSDAYSDAAIRRFVARVGIENVRPLAQLRLADISAMGHGKANPMLLMPLLDRIDSLVAAENAFGLKDLAIDGRDLIALGYKPGPGLGNALTELLELVLDDPGMNDRKKLEFVAANIKHKHQRSG
ncbi:HD domain-containing protein [Spirochaetota bacterium]